MFFVPVGRNGETPLVSHEPAHVPKCFLLEVCARRGLKRVHRQKFQHLQHVDDAEPVDLRWGAAAVAAFGVDAAVLPVPDGSSCRR